LPLAQPRIVLAVSLCYPLLELPGLPGLRVLPLAALKVAALKVAALKVAVPWVAALKVAALKVAVPWVAALKVAVPWVAALKVAVPWVAALKVAALKVAQAIPLSHVMPRFVVVTLQTAPSLSEVSKALTPAGHEVSVGVGPCDTHLRQREYSQASQVECLA